MKNVKYCWNKSWNATGLSKDRKFACLERCNPMEESNKTGEEKKIWYLFLRVL